MPKGILLTQQQRKVAVISRLRTILRADRQNELDMPPSRRITELLIAITDLIHDLETLNQKTQ